MNYISYSFVVLFLVAVISRFTVGRDSRNPLYLAILLVLSLVFYAWHIPQYLPILLFSSLIDFIAGQKLVLYDKGTFQRKFWLWTSITVNLGMLCFFKYCDFFIQSANDVLSTLHLSDFYLSKLNIILPLGISFYTFQSMSYTIDIYRGKLDPCKQFWKFILYVSFFPQLVAGPIVRGTEFLYQFQRRRMIRPQFVTEGIYLLIRGLFLKMVIADNMASPVNYYWTQVVAGQTDSLVAILIVFLFWVQMFCDFAGYSSIARGLAYILGYRLPLNFNAPFLCSSISEFWRRWHITLGKWLQDALLKPLLSQKKLVSQQYFALIVTMTLCGFWHGAAWTFINFGLCNGIIMSIERRLKVSNPKRIKSKRKLALCIIVTNINIFFFSMLLFRSETMKDYFMFIRTIFTGGFQGIQDVGLFVSLGLAIPVAVMHVRTYLFEQKILPALTSVEKAVASALMLYGILTFYGGNSDFIYFQF